MVDFITYELIFWKKQVLAFTFWWFFDIMASGTENCWEGRIHIRDNELDLDLTLLGGQSFRWEKYKSTQPPKWTGVAFDAYWELTQTNNVIDYKVYPCLGTADRQVLCTEYFSKTLHNYFRLDFDIKGAIKQWKSAHMHFGEAARRVNGVRVLAQEPFENILVFICSQNNRIRRITSMIQWLCSKYGCKIGTFNGKDQFTFPTLEILIENKQLESELREAKFGYRAKFIAKTVASISDFGGLSWLLKLRNLSYEAARLELLKLPGIGFKVADCICLMSLNHLESIPIDTHIFKIVQTAYMPHLAKLNSISPKTYTEIGRHLRSIYGKYAGWAQAIIFCSDLPLFQSCSDTDKDAIDWQSITKKKK